MTGIQQRSAARHVVIALAAGTIAVFGLFIVVFAAHRVVTPMEGLKRFVDIGGESNLPSWWNSSLLSLIAIAAIVAGAMAGRYNRRERRAWWVVGCAALYLSLDEAAGLHERLDGVVETLGIDPPTYAWVIPGSVLAAAGVGVLVLFGRHLPGTIGGRLGLALGVYAVGALGVEGISGWIREHDWSAMYTVAIIVEEGLEMGACVFAAAVIIDSVIQRYQIGHQPSSVPSDRVLA